MDNNPNIQDVPEQNVSAEQIFSDTSTKSTGPPQKPRWYFNTWFIALLSACWFLYGIPILLAAVLMFLKNKNEKTLYAQANQLYSDNCKYEKLLTPEMQDAYQLQLFIDTLHKEESHVKANIDKHNETVEKINSQIKELEEQLETKKKDYDKQIEIKKKELIVMDEDILVQEFGLYKPQYDFASALGYKEELAKIRSTQKELIKNKQAVRGDTNWQVNGSAAKGRKMVSDTQKLLLRAFNNECDDLVAKVKYTNFDASWNKIDRSAETISKLGTVMNISITKEYLDAKKKELCLAFEYRQKQQEEKEALKAAREEQREQARVQREIEEQRKRIEKEQAHYQTAYKKLMNQLSGNVTDEELLKKKAELENHLSDIDRALADIDYRQANMRAGYVYVISNIGAFGENVYKIGMTRRLDPQERVDELGDASVPFRFDVHAMIFSDDAPALEAALHRAFEDRKLNMVNTRREFFNVTLDEIKEVVKANFDKTVEFIDVPDAEQYRVSQKMKNEKLHN